MTLEALKSEPFVAVQIQEGSGFNARVAQICAKGGLSPQITQRAGQFTALAGLVAGGLGVAFVPDSLRHLQIADVVYRPLAKINQHSDLAMVYRKFVSTRNWMRGLRRLGGFRPEFGLPHCRWSKSFSGALFDLIDCSGPMCRRAEGHCRRFRILVSAR